MGLALLGRPIKPYRYTWTHIRLSNDYSNNLPLSLPCITIVCHNIGYSFPYLAGNEPPDVTGKNVLVVDYSYSLPATKKMIQQAKKLVILDHHKSSTCSTVQFVLTILQKTCLSYKVYLMPSLISIRVGRAWHGSTSIRRKLRLSFSNTSRTETCGGGNYRVRKSSRRACTPCR